MELRISSVGGYRDDYLELSRTSFVSHKPIHPTRSSCRQGSGWHVAFRKFQFERYKNPYMVVRSVGSQ